jgi:hypothetical protein
MKAKKFDAVEMKRRLQKEAEQKMSTLSEEKQLELFAKKFGHLRKPKKGDTHRLTQHKRFVPYSIHPNHSLTLKTSFMLGTLGAMPSPTKNHVR